ncbi:hypothetical protein [Sinimarinibacterium flocculans]|uniref:hypothetical protein n=1 Tax=Sinimarinibacterium flocculans TaxID=985250 RepID=UPI003512BC93
MEQRHRWAVWGVLLVASGFAAFGVDDDPPMVVEPARRAARLAGSAPAQDRSPETALYILETRMLSAQSLGNPFGVPDAPAPVYVEPVVAEVSEVYIEPPPAEVLPPLPFRVAGVLESGRRWLVQLERSGENLVVEKGETVDGMYRVDGLRDDQLVLTYLPLGQQQMLPTSAEE